jgi:hypothetical protein
MTSVALAASVTYSWVNVRTIAGSDGTTYTWNGDTGTNIFASTKLPSPQCTTDPTINNAYKSFNNAALIDATSGLGGTDYTLYTYKNYPNQTSGLCQETKQGITLGDPSAQGIGYVWIDSLRIQAYAAGDTGVGTDNWGDTQLYTSKDGVNFTAGGATCPSKLVVSANHTSASITRAQPPNSSGDIGSNTTVVNGCTVQSSATTFTLGSPQNHLLAPGAGKIIAPPTTTTTTTPADAQAVCNVDSLTWLVCPIISVAQGAVNSLTGVVKNQLQFQPLSNGNTGLKPAWTIFRNLADVFFVLIFFIVIFGTSMGLDNYTVKKVLPRLIAAAVLVQFSYLLVGFMVDVSNVLGMGIDSLLAAAIPAGAKTGNEGVMQVAGGLELIGGIAGAAALLPFLAEFAIPLLLALFSAIIGLVAVFVTLQIRIMLIDFLIILSPVALLLWVLPNTDKYFKMWRETLIKLLLMYPIIILLLATSKLFSVIITGAGDVSNWTKLSAALAPIIALFLIPATFKFAGSALMAGSNMVGKVSGRGQKGIAGMQDKMKQNRSYNRQQKGLSKINALDNGEASKTRLGRMMAGLPGGKTAQRRVAQHQAGMSIDNIDPNRMAGALEKNDRDQLTSASRRLENETPETLKDKALDPNADQFTRRAAIAKLSQIEDTGALQEILSSSRYNNDNTNSEWTKATAGNYSGLKEKAPHLVPGPGKAQPGLGGTNSGFDSITADRATKLDTVGAQAMVDRRAALSQAHATATGTAKDAAKSSLDAFDTNMRNVVVGINRSTAGVNNIKNPTRDKLNELSQHPSIGENILTPVEKANLQTSQGGGGGTQGSTGGTSTGPSTGGGSGPSGGGSSSGGFGGGSVFGGSSSGGSAPSGSGSSGGGSSSGSSYGTSLVQPVNSSSSSAGAFNPTTADQQVRGSVSGGWSTTDSGLVVPTSSLPTPVSATPAAPTTSGGNITNTHVTINVPSGSAPNTTAPSIPTEAPVTWKTVPSRGSAANEAPTYFTPAVPGNRFTGPKTSLRLVSHDQTAEPGDDRSIS